MGPPPPAPHNTNTAAAQGSCRRHWSPRLLDARREHSPCAAYRQARGGIPAPPHTDNTDGRRGQARCAHRYTAVRWSCAPPQVWCSTGARLARLRGRRARARHIHHLSPFMPPPLAVTRAHAHTSTPPRPPPAAPDGADARRHLSRREETRKSRGSNSAERLLPAFTTSRAQHSTGVTVLSRVTFPGPRRASGGQVTRTARRGVC